MKIKALTIKNFKSIQEMHITNIDNTLILVGKNNTGKSSILSAIKVFCSLATVSSFDYNQHGKSIEIHMSLELSSEDLIELNTQGKVSKFRRFDRWMEDFCKKFPSYKDGIVEIQCKITMDGDKKYSDGCQKNNPFILELIPSLYIIDEQRNMNYINQHLMELQGLTDIEDAKTNICIFNQTKKCYDCFECIPVINKKTPLDLSIYETILLTKYKLHSSNLQVYQNNVNLYFQKSYGSQYEIQYKYDFDIEALLSVSTYAMNLENNSKMPIDVVSTSMKSMYVLSLLQAYLDNEERTSSIVLVDQPEIHLHPELQKITSEILYKLSKKNQVMFTTHSPNMLFNFSTNQIKQVVLDSSHHTTIKENTNLDLILDDLGYNANDLMNVSFVFIVEGKDDRSRLPLLLDRYYKEVRDGEGHMSRIAIIPTNSCTNIKTYANLKFINQTYLKDNFLMIRDSDGKDPAFLTEQLCSYYFRRNHDDDAKIPRITPKNVLILKYYSFENYFLNPEIMTQLGIIHQVEEFYALLYAKYTQYMHGIKSAKVFAEKTGVHIQSKDDIMNNIESFKIYMRGHNLFDIFYAKYKTKEEQTAILKKYVEIAPREEFQDILDSIDHFIFFDNRKK